MSVLPPAVPESEGEKEWLEEEKRRSAGLPC